MSKQITFEEIKGNPYFWYMYIKWFRGFDDKNELNLDEAMEAIDIDQNQVQQWEEDFFAEISDENVKLIAGKLNDEMSFRIEFQEYEIVFFLNETYIGNLGGHFEAWFLTWQELLAFEKHPLLFMLLLPMTGIEQHQIEDAKALIAKHLKIIPKFEKEAAYITYCILNGLIMDDGFLNHNEIGTINIQNHSARNVEKYPRYSDDVKKLNIELNKFIKH
ncbi:Imm19 family immunity protein [Pedobacter xixiisoli]|uniref:Immunity protein 19 n=1 Tax=Pedobacter xixiisoli TaxID=1476464 RepID=A0A285ZPN9_9SPHI|nr:Imm19 family immunity protein [Pedobacter xixiisoli]SOD11588.1 Immunity protein 19 [Pedobacter xixiisoli]